MTTTAPEETRPFWLTSDCPPWCSKEHYPGDTGLERCHANDGQTIHLTLHEGWGPLDEAQPVHVWLSQHPREAEPFVELWWLPRDTTIRMTLAEASDLASFISAAVTAARHTTQGDPS